MNISRNMQLQRNKHKGLLEVIEEIESSSGGFGSIVQYMQHMEEVAEKLAHKNMTIPGTIM